jgi:transposase
MKRHIVKLSAAEHEQLRILTRTGSAKAQELRRAHILLNADENGPALKDEYIATALGITVQTVERICKRYCAKGLEKAVRRKPRPDKGVPRKLDGAVEARLLALACSDAPNEAPRWLADEIVRLDALDSLSLESVCQVLKKTRLSHT